MVHHLDSTKVKVKDIHEVNDDYLKIIDISSLNIPLVTNSNPVEIEIASHNDAVFVDDNYDDKQENILS